MPVSVDLVLPCFNPPDTWTRELLSFNEFIKSFYTLHYIVVNDGSVNHKIPDQIAFLQKNNISLQYVSYEKNMGKGYALREGVKASKAEFIVYTDIDFPFTNQSTSDLIYMLLNGKFDVVAGYRDAFYYQKKMSGFRKLLSRTFRSFIKNVLKMAVSDTQCGLKGFNKKGKDKFLSTKTNRYLFDFEFIYLSGKDQSVSVKAFPVQLKDNVVFSKMKMKILAQEMLNLFSILFFRKN